MIRKAAPCDRERVKSLWSYCFYDSEPFLSWWFNRVYSAENTVIADENGNLAGALQTVDYGICVSDKVYNASYICGVSVWPQYRGNGIGARMLSFAEEDARRRGRDFLILISDAEGYYEKYGYVSCFERTEYVFHPRDVQRPCAKHIKRADISDAGVLLSLYGAYAEKYDCRIVRTADDMRMAAEQYGLYRGGIYIVYDSCGKAEGYIAFYIENKTLIADEIVYTSLSGINSLLGIIYSHGSQVDKAVIKTSTDDPMRYLIYGKTVEMHRIPTVMVKALNGGDPQKVFWHSGGALAELIGAKTGGGTPKTCFINII